MHIIKQFEPILGRWYVESRIGSGSFGRVYKIYRNELNTRVYAALKYISVPSDDADIDQHKMSGLDVGSISTYYGKMAKDVQIEIDIMRNLSGNTNIVDYKDSEIMPKANGIGFDIFIVMELLTPVSDLMKNQSFPSSSEDVVNLGQDICDALILCHESNIMHRDIKPENIFVSGSGRCKLGDFGIARLIDSNKNASMSQRGTLNYIAPEVYKERKYTESCDVYSLGISLYRLLNNGRLPFVPISGQIWAEDNDRAFTRRIRGEEMPAPCNADEKLSEIVLKACAYDPSNRFSSAKEMRKALEQYSRGEYVLTGVVNGANRGQAAGGEDGDDPDVPPASGGTISVVPPMDFNEPKEPGIGQGEPEEAKGESDTGKKALGNEGELSEGSNKKKLQNESAGIGTKKRIHAKEKKNHAIIAMGIVSVIAVAFGLLALFGVFSNKPEEELSASSITPAPATQIPYSEQTALPTPEVTAVPTAAPTATPSPTPTPAQTPSSVPTVEPTPQSTPYDFIVTFEDEAFERAFRNKYYLNGPIWDSVIKGFKELDLSNEGITDIRDISKFTELTKLCLNSNRISNVEPLSELHNLKYLSIHSNKISNIEYLSVLTNLEELRIHANEIYNVDVLANLNKLKIIELGYNKISNINALGSLHNLEVLYIQKSAITDISPLRNLPLKNLCLQRNKSKIIDLSIIGDIETLTDLDLCAMEAQQLGDSDIGFLSNLVSLERLFIKENAGITTLSPLDNLYSIKKISIHGTGVSVSEQNRFLQRHPSCKIDLTPLGD